MDSGYYAAMSGLVARTQALDTTAANLANAQTPGYRAEREYFRSVLVGPDAQDSQLGQAANRYGILGGDQLSMVQGPVKETGNPLDMAILGDGFFAVMTAAGIRYTRDGSFHRSQQGQLVTDRNEPVLSSKKQPIAIPPGAVSVGGDGLLSVEGGAVDAVGLFRFASGTAITPEGANRYAAPENIASQPTTDSIIRGGALEGANQDVVKGTLDLMMMQRQAEMMQKALTIFHTDFDKFAAEDLVRV
jgi:flagellar basal-body rod protein FlgF